MTIIPPLYVRPSYDNKDFSTALTSIKPRPEAADLMFFMVKRNNLLFKETLQTSIQPNPGHFNSGATKWLYFAGETRGWPGSLCHQKPKQFVGRRTFRFVARLVSSQTPSSFLAGL